MDIDIEKLIKAAAESLDLSKHKGDIVGVKVVENEIGYIEQGGIGIQNVYSNEKKNEAKTGQTDCCFFYDNEEYFSIAIQQFTNVLRKYKLVPEEMDLKKMEHLFQGKPCRTKYTWLGDRTKRHILTHIIKGLTNPDNPIITTWPEGTSPWEVVSCRFIDEDGYALPNIRQETARKKTQSIVEEAVNALAGHL